MARYYPISPMFWADHKVQGWDDQTRLLALYTLTCEHRNLEGLYRLPWAYVSADLGWEADTVGENMSKLLEAGFIEYDQGPKVLLVRNALKYQQPKSKPQIKGAITSLAQVPETHLLDSLLRVADTHAPTLAKAMRKAFADRLVTHA